MLAFAGHWDAALSALAPSGTGTIGSGRYGTGGARDRFDQPDPNDSQRISRVSAKKP